MQTPSAATGSGGGSSSSKKKRGAPRHSNSSNGNKKPTTPLHETARLDNEDYDVAGIHNHSHEHSTSSGSGEGNGHGAGAALADMNDEEAAGQRQQLHAARPIDPTRPLNQQVPVDTVQSV
jgi:hypothetical protein